jgi:O-antigen/teichoic acid export membrane protein
LGTAVVLSQVLTYVLTFIALRRCFSGLCFAFRFVNGKTLLQMAHYGVYTLVSTLATLLVNQGPVLLVGRLLSALYVGVYSLPVRLLANLTDAVAQIAMVMVASTADLSARGELRAVSGLAIVVNRYCLALFLPLSIVLWVYGADIFRLWVGGDAAMESARLLPVLVLGATFGVAGQHNSNAALFGLGKHRGFAYGLLIEGLLGASGIALVLPTYGLLGAVAVSTVLLLANRGLWAPWLVCRHTRTPFFWYMREIYLRPIVTAAPVLLGASLLRLSVLPGTSWPELATAAASIGLVTYALAWAVCVRPEHRSGIWRHARGSLPPWRPTFLRGRTPHAAIGTQDLTALRRA